MNPFEWYLDVLKKYTVFTGRAHRAEFWWFVLFNIIVSMVLGWIWQFLSTLYGLAVLLPAIGVGIRRLHDTGRSGWWLLLSFIPVIGSIVLIIFFALEGEPGENQYGPNPEVIQPAV